MRALVFVVAGLTGCSFLVDLDGVRPRDGDGTDGGGTPDGFPSTPLFVLPSLFGVDDALLEGIGYRLDPDNPDLPAGVHAPIPVVVGGLKPGDTIEISVPGGFTRPFIVCGVERTAADGAADIASLPAPCAMRGSRAAFTVAVPVEPTLDEGQPVAPLEITIRDAASDVAGVLEVAIRPLDELRHVVAGSASPVTGTFSVVDVAAAYAPDPAGPGVQWRATSHARIAARIDVSGRGAPACDLDGLCLGGTGGPGSPGTGATDPCGQAACSASGEGGGEGAARCSVNSCLTVKGAGGGGGGHAVVGGTGGEGGQFCNSRGDGGPARPDAANLVTIENAWGGGGGAGTRAVHNLATAPDAPGGGGGGGGGVLALDVLGTVVFAGAGEIDASGGRGAFGVNAGGCTGGRTGGDGGGGAGGGIRILAERVVPDALELDDLVDAAGGSRGNGGTGARGRIRVDAIGSGSLDDGVDGNLRGPFVQDPQPPSIVTEPTLLIAVDGGSQLTSVEIGLRRANASSYRVLPSIPAGVTSQVAGDLEPGLNELCLFLERPTSYDVSAIPEAMRRCVWIAYLPDE